MNLGSLTSTPFVHVKIPYNWHHGPHIFRSQYNSLCAIFKNCIIIIIIHGKGKLLGDLRLILDENVNIEDDAKEEKGEVEVEEDFAVIDFCDECVYALLDLSIYLSPHWNL